MAKLKKKKTEEKEDGEDYVEINDDLRHEYEEAKEEDKEDKIDEEESEAEASQEYKEEEPVKRSQ
ncbi:hypothetical protein M1293_01355 [Candidatus Parvarchaeota archaeon]|nr:hypothetical protein [Candidatus Parvarchaeota archaeon]